MLYSYKGLYPTSLPFRIVLSNNRTRTDQSTFTEEEILDAGYILAPELPTVEPWQILNWVDNSWVVEDKDLFQEKDRLQKQVNLIRENKIYQNREIVISETPLKSIPIDFRKNTTDLQNIRDLSQRSLVALINNEDISIEFRGSDNQSYFLSAQDIIQIGLQITKIISSFYKISWDKKAKIDACTSLADLYAININNEWD